MGNIVISPDVVRRIEDNIEYLISTGWQRRQAAQWWKRVVKTRSQATKREVLQWMLETARIEPMGNGGNQSLDDLVEVTHESIVERFGKALKLGVDEIEDGAALDRAGQWARQVGGYAGEWPQIQTTSMLKKGKLSDKLAYDSLTFWHASHLVNPYDASDGTYANIHYDMPFSAANLATAFKTVAQIKGPDGLYRKLKPSIIACGEIERLAVTQALTAEFFADPVAGGAVAAAQNVIKTSYGFQAPIIDADFDETGDAYYNNSTGAYQGATTASGTIATRGVWYLFCELVEDDTLGGIVFNEAKPFTLNSYSYLDDAALAHADEFEWAFKGRNGCMYGHPFLVHRFEPNPSSGSVSP